MSLLGPATSHMPGPELAFLGMTVMFLFFGVLLVVAILLAVWVYRDAEARDMDGVLWLIVVLLTNVIGLIIYLIVRADHPEREDRPPARAGQPTGPFCSNCGRRLREGDRFCSSCGHDVTGEPG